VLAVRSLLLLASPAGEVISVTRREWRQAVEFFATQRPTVTVCATLTKWETAMVTTVPKCSPATQAKARALATTLQSGPCGDCGVSVIWGRATPLEPLKICEGCAEARITAARSRGVAVLDVTPADFDDEAGRR